MVCTVCYILLAKTMIIIRFIRKKQYSYLKRVMVTILTPAEKDSSVIVDSGAKLDAVEQT